MSPPCDWQIVADNGWPWDEHKTKSVRIGDSHKAIWIVGMICRQRRVVGPPSPSSSPSPSPSPSPSSCFLFLLLPQEKRCLSQVVFWVSKKHVLRTSIGDVKICGGFRSRWWSAQLRARDSAACTLVARRTLQFFPRWRRPWGDRP